MSGDLTVSGTQTMTGATTVDDLTVGGLATVAETLGVTGLLTVGGRIANTVSTGATVPAATSLNGQMVYLSDGAAGSPVIAFSDGTNWLRCDTLATAAAS